MVLSKSAPSVDRDEDLELPTLRRQTSPLLATPLEVRAQIFDELLPFSVLNHINLLCVSKELYREVQKYIYKRPVRFQSQTAFFEWIGKHTEDYQQTNLRHVHSLSLKVLDIGPDDMQACWMRTGGLQDLASPGFILNVDNNPYRRDVDRIIAGLRLMPNISDLSILKPAKTESSPTCDVYEAIFRFVKSSYPQLQRLALYIDKMPLTFLPPLKNLRSLWFTGFSVTSPPDTLKYLTSLPRLEELSLRGPPRGLDWQQRTGFKGGAIVQSITPDVLKGLNPLRSLTICETFDAMRLSGPCFLTPQIISSIEESHASSLRHLHLAADFALRNDTQKSICSLLENMTSLTHLTAAWSKMNSNLIDALPSTLTSLSIAAHCGLCPADIADTTIRRSPHLPDLEEVILKVYHESEDAHILCTSVSETTEEQDTESVSKAFEGIGCKCRFETLTPLPDEDSPKQRDTRPEVQSGSGCEKDTLKD